MSEIITLARGWLGTKFHHQGRKKNVGVDCIGFVIGVMREYGIIVEDQQNYARQPRAGQLQKALENKLIKSDLQVGAIALFKIDKEPQHVGIISNYQDGFGLIHAFAASRKVVEHRLDDMWRARLVACYKLAE